MAFSAAYASRLTTRLAPGAFTTTTTLALAYTAASEQGTARASQQATTIASRHLVTMATRTTTTASSSSSSSSTTTSTVSSSCSSTRIASRVPWKNGIIINAPPQRFMSSSTKKSGGFVEWYEGHLQNRPIPTKMVTGSILWSLGDAVAQTVPAAAAGTFDPATFQYDWMRTGRAFAFGFILHAPASHAHFNFLEWMTVRAGVTGMKIPIFKVYASERTAITEFTSPSFDIFVLAKNDRKQGLYGTIRILELDQQQHVPRCYGLHARAKYDPSDRQNQQCLVGDAKGSMGLLDTHPAPELSVCPRATPVECRSSHIGSMDGTSLRVVSSRSCRRRRGASGLEGTGPNQASPVFDYAAKWRRSGRCIQNSRPRATAWGSHFEGHSFVFAGYVPILFAFESSAIKTSRPLRYMGNVKKV
eukprot:scaffold8363_cov163-Amphora_coffeaeformis.AAC.4